MSGWESDEPEREPILKTRARFSIHRGGTPPHLHP